MGLCSCITCKFAKRDSGNRYVDMCSGYSNCNYQEFDGVVELTDEEKLLKRIDMLERIIRDDVYKSVFHNGYLAALIDLRVFINNGYGVED